MANYKNTVLYFEYDLVFVVALSVLKCFSLFIMHQPA